MHSQAAAGLHKPLQKPAAEKPGLQLSITCSRHSHPKSGSHSASQLTLQVPGEVQTPPPQRWPLVHSPALPSPTVPLQSPEPSASKSQLPQLTALHTLAEQLLLAHSQLPPA